MPVSYKVDGAEIKARRHEMGLSQKRFADTVGLSENTILKAERGGPLRFDSVSTLCEHLGVSFKLLIDSEDVTSVSASHPKDSDESEVGIVIPGDADTDPELALNFVKELKAKLELGRIVIESGRIGSIHLNLRVSKEDAKKLREAADSITRDGEFRFDTTSDEKEARGSAGTIQVYTEAGATSGAKVLIHPLDDRVVVEPIHEDGEHFMMAIPHHGRVEKRNLPRGTVVAVGPGKMLDNGSRGAISVSVGDVVIYGKYGGTDIEVDGSEVKILREADILRTVLGTNES